MDSLEQKVHNETVVLLLRDLQRFPKREIAKHIEREVIRPGAHVPAFRPIAFRGSLSEVVAPLSNMVYDLRLHISKSALRESMRE